MANCPAVFHRHKPGSKERGGCFPAWVGWQEGQERTSGSQTMGAGANSVQESVCICLAAVSPDVCVGVYLGPGECDFSGSDSTPGRPLEMRCLRLLCRPPAPGSAFSQDAGEVHVHIQVQVCLLHTGRRAPCRSRRRAVLRRLVNTRAWRDSDTNSCVLPGTGVHAQSPC